MQMHMAGFVLWRSSSNFEDNSSCIYEGNEDNDMHNEKWKSVEWLHVGLSLHHKVATKSKKQPSSFKHYNSKAKTFNNESYET